MKKKVIITGVSGFIGSNLAKKYLNSDYIVYGVAKEDEQFAIDNKDFHIIYCDFENYANLAKLFDTSCFECFIHLAWQGYGKQTNDYKIQVMNIFHACEAAEAAIKLGCKKIIFADSSHEYLKSTNKNGETDFCSIYGSSKFCASRLVSVLAHNAGINFNGVLFTNVYGIGDYSSRTTNIFLKKLGNNEDLDLVTGTNLYDWTYIDDVLNGIFETDIRGSNGIVYYVGSNKLRMFKDIITDVRDAVSPNSKLNFGVYNDESFIDYSYIDVDKLSSDTDYVPVCDLKESVIKTLNWINNQSNKETK